MEIKLCAFLVSFVGKKINVSSDGQEDMGGIGGAEMKSRTDLIHEELKFISRYDALSSSGKSLIGKLGAIYGMPADK